MARRGTSIRTNIFDTLIEAIRWGKAQEAEGYNVWLQEPTETETAK